MQVADANFAHGTPPANTTARRQRRRLSSGVRNGFAAIFLFAANAFLSINLHYSWLTPLAVLATVALSIMTAFLLVRDLVARPDRLTATILLIMVSIVTFHLLLGGNTNWFDVGMRLRVRRAGGLDALRAWATKVVNDPDAGQVIEQEAVPQLIQRVTDGFGILVEHPNNGDGGRIILIRSGWDAGQGLVICTGAVTSQKLWGTSHRVWASDVYLWTKP